MSNLEKIFPKTCIICDDIRLENTGKLLLIGIYQNTIVVRKEGVALHLALWVPFESNKVGTAEIHIKLTDPKGEELIIPLKEKLTPETPQRSFSIMGISIKETALGELRVDYKNKGDEEWELLSKYQIKKTD